MKCPKCGHEFNSNLKESKHSFLPEYVLEGEWYRIYMPENCYILCDCGKEAVKGFYRKPRPNIPIKGLLPRLQLDEYICDECFIRIYGREEYYKLTKHEEWYKHQAELRKFLQAAQEILK